MTLRHKIVSLTFGILVLFALTAFTALVLQDRIGRRFDGVVGYQMPLNAAIAEIDVLTDRYELKQLRLIADLSTAGATATAAIDQYEAEREQEAKGMREAIDRVEELLARALQDDPNVSTDDRIALAEVRGRFSYLDRAMPEFLNVGQQLSAKIRAGDPVDGSRVAREFAPYRTLFGDDLTAIRGHLASLSAAAAQNVARMQREHVIVEVVMLALATLVGIGLALVVSNRMMIGLARLIERTGRMQDGQDYEVLPVLSRDEIGTLTIAFNRMVEDLRAKDRIKETFGKYIDPRIVTTLIEPANGDALAERQTSTVFFSDIKGFSSISELLTAPTLVKLLNTYFSEVSAVIQAHNGIIDKYIGDGVMAFWTAPFSPGETHASDACIAALKQQDAVQKLREHMSEVLGLRRNLPEFSVRMGIATGDLVVGTIGSPNAQSFTVIGDTVNLASRLEGANKAYRTSILVNEEAYRLAQHEIEARELDFITVVGKAEPVRIYEVMGITGSLSSEQQELRGLFAEGLAAYRERDWDRAEKKFAKCLSVVATDAPAIIFSERVAALREQSLSANWDGVWHLAEK
jgi:class 3 adenylate cyclase